MWSINGITQTLTTDQKTQVLIDTCTQLGFDIPRFCYHENLKIAGNCRMRLIEDTKAPKPVICCAGNPTVDLNIFTNTVQVKKSREAVMEFLLINHPLDCPICDQGGECDLQDLALVYGSDHGRFYDYKRNVEDKNCGPVVKTVMNRCILCTRCVRFASDIAGFESLGLTGRGGKMEIGSYVEKLLDSDLSGNLIDVCPVGALTSKPYSFVSRPWEVKKANLFALIDDQPQLIRADIKENEIVRFLPSKNAAGLNLWITNRTRFSYEGLTRNRVMLPALFGLQTNWINILNTFKVLIAKVLAGADFKEKRILSFKLNDILNFDYFDLSFAKNILNSSGLISNSRKSVFFTFLPRVSNFSATVNSLILINLNLNFELPITSLLIQQCLTSTESAPFLLNWRGVATSILKPFQLILDSSISSIINFLEGKTWFNSLFVNNFNTPVTTICLYTLEWDYIFQGLKTKFFKFLILFLFTPAPAYRVLFDINLFSENLLVESSKTFCLVDWSLGGWSSRRFSDSSLSLLHSSHAVDESENLAFLLPAKSYIENNSIFYNLDYTYFKSFKVISAPVNAKTIKNFVKVMFKLLNITPYSQNLLEPLSGLKSISYLTSQLFDRDLKCFFSINRALGKKTLSKANTYQMFSILTHSPTLSALQQANFNVNIY